jgi:hypothetical protein
VVTTLSFRLPKPLARRSRISLRVAAESVLHSRASCTMEYVASLPIAAPRYLDGSRSGADTAYSR